MLSYCFLPGRSLEHVEQKGISCYWSETKDNKKRHRWSPTSRPFTEDSHPRRQRTRGETTRPGPPSSRPVPRLQFPVSPSRPLRPLGPIRRLNSTPDPRLKTGEDPRPDFVSPTIESIKDPELRDEDTDTPQVPHSLILDTGTSRREHRNRNPRGLRRPTSHDTGPMWEEISVSSYNTLILGVLR